MPKERIQLENLFEASCVTCGANKHMNCENARCINYGVCAMCAHYKEYYTVCEKKCLFFNHHKAFPTIDMSNVEFIKNPEVKKYIEANFKHVNSKPIK